MYFWNLHALKTTLKERPLTDYEALPYYFVVAFLIQLDANASAYFASVDPPSSSNILIDAIFAAIGLAGIFWAYVRNGGQRGFSFFPRYFAIGWVVGIQLIVAIIAPFIILLTVFAAFESYGITTIEPLFDVVLNVFSFSVELVYCYLVAKNVGEVADAWPSGTPPSITQEVGDGDAISEATTA